MAGRVTLVCGPPCAGKSTYVRQHASPGDLVVCFDRLAQAAGSPRTHGHDMPYRQAATMAYARLVSDLPTDRDAWVIRCLPQPGSRAALAELLGADEVIVIVPPLAIALARARNQRPPQVQQGVRRWYARYQPRVGERVLDGRSRA